MTDISIEKITKLYKQNELRLLYTKVKWTYNDQLYWIYYILKQYPSTPVVFHRTYDEQNKMFYEILDGLQRINTARLFLTDKLSFETSDFLKLNPDSVETDHLHERVFFSNLKPKHQTLFRLYLIKVIIFHEIDNKQLKQIVDCVQMRCNVVLERKQYLTTKQLLKECGISIYLPKKLSVSSFGAHLGKMWKKTFQKEPHVITFTYQNEERHCNAYPREKFEFLQKTICQYYALYCCACGKKKHSDECCQ